MHSQGLIAPELGIWCDIEESREFVEKYYPGRRPPDRLPPSLNVQGTGMVGGDRAAQVPELMVPTTGLYPAPQPLHALPSPGDSENSCGRGLAAPCPELG